MLVSVRGLLYLKLIWNVKIFQMVNEIWKETNICATFFVIVLYHLCVIINWGIQKSIHSWGLLFRWSRRQVEYVISANRCGHIIVQWIYQSAHEVCFLNCFCALTFRLQDFLRRTETLLVLTCCNWSTSQQTNFFSSYLPKILEWVQRQGNELQHYQLSSKSLWICSWKLWVVVSLSSFVVSNPMSSRSQWSVLNIFSIAISNCRFSIGTVITIYESVNL